ncbi:WecB/TagA/CpsF family glycosyltransferase [Gloeobacter morelensis]|uniref:WecB/TagA/CpsF family glycosyltransferase n=1 Tax=Gloeobacter morelensis MG652769 TaxID=2781736 RepID=A0ABY3PHW5_9CYAN|nr:WecB/TagA/CpsF family glycosyltransferase [Gloeobacter morelensis]UFP93270.1 WecB/TagA/CpsF family glycosyltransferase [Gloeobacter morelensis MG652769]
MTALPTAPILDLPVHLSADYTHALVELVEAGQGGYVITLNAEMAMLAQREERLARLIRRADLVVPDGAGVVWALQRVGRRVRRCAGIDLVESALQQLAPRHTRIFLLGAAPGVAEAVGEGWRRQYPGLVVAGARDGFFGPDEESALLEGIAHSRPQLVLAGLGVPKQEYWIERARRRLTNVVFVGVGGSFDIWSGSKERAPRWLRENYLEWLYRLYREPWRAKRMLALPRFALAILRGVGR